MMPRASNLRRDEAPKSDTRSGIREVGHCKILAELGHGGMANVYLAVTQSQAGVNKLVVLKALRPEQASEPEALAMFLDEAKIAAQLNHPNVVQTYEVGRHADRYVMVMEYLEGQALSRIIREGQNAGKQLPLPIGLRIVSAALDGLHYAHELTSYTGTALGLVHRDISPQNIFVTYQGQVKVLDFGIAKAASSSTHTAAGIIKGKFSYMSPEHMTGHVLDRRADIFSMGCVLWALATGEKLWHGVPDVQIMRRVLRNAIPSPRTLKPDCDAELERIIMKCLAHDRDKRYATALECQTDLDQLCERLGYLVKHKAIGTFVSELFVEHQSQVREIVELQLSRSSLASMRPPPMPDDSSPPSSEVGGHSIATKTAPRRRRWPFVLLAAALTASALVLPRVIVSRSPEVAKAEGKAKPSDLPKAVHVAAPEPVKEATIRFIVSPRETRLLLNETPLSDHTTELRLPVDGKEHTLRAEAEGYESKSLPFTVTEDAALDLTLVKSSSKPGKATIRPRLPTTPRRAAAPVDAPTRATAAHEKPTTPACNDPFFIDAAGIKRVRPECR